MDGHTSITLLRLGDTDKRRLGEAGIHTLSALQAALDDGSLQQKVGGIGPDGEKRVGNAVAAFRQKQQRMSDASEESEKQRVWLSRENLLNRKWQFAGVALTAISAVVVGILTFMPKNEVDSDKPQPSILVAEAGRLSRERLQETALNVPNPKIHPA